MVKIKELAKDNSTAARTATEEDIVNFQNKNRISLPRDLIEYFRLYNGTSSEYNARFFCFYSLMEFQPLRQEFEEWITRLSKHCKDLGSAGKLLCLR